MKNLLKLAVEHKANNKLLATIPDKVVEYKGNFLDNRPLSDICKITYFMDSIVSEYAFQNTLIGEKVSSYFRYLGVDEELFRINYPDKYNLLINIENVKKKTNHLGESIIKVVRRRKV